MITKSSRTPARPPSSRETTDRLETVDLLRLLIDSVVDYAIFVLDPTGNVLTWNKGAQRIKGYSADEIIGKHFSSFYPREEINAGKPDRELTEAARVGRFEDEGWRLRKDGSRFWANVVITALRDETGELAGFAKVTRDLTERKEAEDRAVNDARRVAEAETESKTKTEFLTAMSHELRTPLNAIGGYAELLRAEVAGPLSEEQDRFVTRIAKSQGHLLGIINDLLNYSKTKAGKLEYWITSVRVKDVLHELASMMQASITLKGLTLKTLPPPITVFALADRSKLEQVVVNLLSNALKFSAAGGTITLSAEQQGPVVTISVSDTGRGIPEDNLERIFEPFVQVGRSLSSASEGTGLGLAISRGIAVGMGGTLTVKSALHKGSTFTLTLAAAPEL
jgi:PAS domain S-box-containing protein